MLYPAELRALTKPSLIYDRCSRVKVILEFGGPLLAPSRPILNRFTFRVVPGLRCVDTPEVEEDTK